MNPVVVSGIYGTALVGPVILAALLTWRLHKQDKQNPFPPVKLADGGDEKILSHATKYIKVICRG